MCIDSFDVEDFEGSVFSVFIWHESSSLRLQIYILSYIVNFGCFGCWRGIETFNGLKNRILSI